MQKYLVCISLIIGLLLVQTVIAHGYQDADNWRLQLRRAIDSETTTDSLFTQLNKVTPRPPLVNAYIAALYGLKAKYSWNPYNKLKYINNAQDVFKSAVNKDPHNVEIRFLRFSVEVNLPAFLHMDKNIDVDKKEIIRQLKGKNYPNNNDEQLTTTIIKFLIESGKCTPDELQQLNQQLTAIK